ncbi:YrrS family protein [Alkalibacillus haloalkaliphilus]|uniref:YrrS family protein n=1 Tax=Alkalibacillus haloalkaliphilus TaxID=94136 RepID=UPI0029354CB4|nr:YrrS family protein [Alkalibacillus haloalkaliphilus]MDV2581070.1 YrrS family protein [Alkalibacillus haloalkaliphilus]
MDHQYSRSERYEKRRKNTKTMNILIWAFIILFVVLIAFWIFGGDDEVEEEQTEQNTSLDEGDEEDEHDENEVIEDEEEQSSEQEESTTDESTEESNEQESGEEHVYESDEDNVVRVFERNWDPVGTEQEEPHTTQFSEGTQDREEMEQAIIYATGMSEDDIIFWRLESGGVANQVIGTVTDSAQQEIYRVYLDWVEHEGWQPQKVEELYENDRHPEYDNDDENEEDEDTSEDDEE